MGTLISILKDALLPVLVIGLFWLAFFNKSSHTDKEKFKIIALIGIISLVLVIQAKLFYYIFDIEERESYQSGAPKEYYIQNYSIEKLTKLERQCIKKMAKQEPPKTAEEEFTRKFKNADCTNLIEAKQALEKKLLKEKK